MKKPPVTREQAIRECGELAAEHEIACAQMTPREQAEAAWTPTSTRSIDEIEDSIRASRGLPPRHARGGAGIEDRHHDGT